MGTFIVSLLPAGAVVMAVRNLIKRKKDGKYVSTELDVPPELDIH